MDIKKIILYAFAVLVVALAVWLGTTHKIIAPQQTATNFDECTAAGFPIMESYPPRCSTPDGEVFIQDIGNELEKTDLIKINEPRPNAVIIGNTITIKGEARGIWFFEASFPIKLLGSDGSELANTIATAKSDWMTEEFVAFEAKIDFQNSGTGKGNLMLIKDNPSGLPENDDSLRIPIKFGG